jgi:hypothetical protein
VGKIRKRSKEWKKLKIKKKTVIKGGSLLPDH